VQSAVGPLGAGDDRSRSPVASRCDAGRRLTNGYFAGTTASRILVVILGLLGGLAGAVHGVAEIRNGNVGTDGHLLKSVGAFTLIPNYRATGVAAVALGAAVVIWTLGFVHRKHGAAVFLGLFAGLFLVGGGFAQVPFFLLAWAVATRIGRPVSWFDHSRLVAWRTRLSAAWLPLLASALTFLAAGLLIWMIVLTPGIERNVSVMHYLCWSLIGGALLLLPCAAVAGLAKDAAAHLGDEGASRHSARR